MNTRREPAMATTPESFVRVNPPWVRRFQAVGTVRAKTLEDRRGG
jgi:hypothetical protein